MQINSQTLLREQVLIVGCGDIGERLAHALPNTYDVTGLRRSAMTDTPQLHYHACDVTDFASLNTIIAAHRFDVIVISMTPSERSDAGYERAYVQTCQHLVASLKQDHHQPRLIVFVSSTGVYGQNDGSWVDEHSPTEPSSFNGKRLLQAEQIIQSSGINSVIIRFSGIYGPGRRRLIDMLLQGRASLSPQITNRIHADDCAAVIAHLIELHKQQILEPIYIASDNTPAPMAEVLSWLAQQLAIDITHLPSAMNLEAGNKRCNNARLLASGFCFRYPDYQTGYRPLLRDLKLQ